MDWGGWIDSARSLDQWKSAAAGISQLFAKPGRVVRQEHRYTNSRAFWVEVREPLDGVRLIAFSLPRHGNTRGAITLRIWTTSGPESVHYHFARGPTYLLQGRACARYTNIEPYGIREKDLQKEDVEVRGVAYGAELADAGEPGEAVATLRSLFETFCKFVMDRHMAGPSAEVDAKESAVRTGPAALQEEQQISNLLDALSDLSDSERDAIAKARMGQSKFRDRLLSRWGDACSVTGLKSKELLIASHIVPWSRCETTNARWDVDNGLMLTPGLDKAFELGYISFQHEGRERGRIVISPKANWDTRRRLGFDDTMLRIRDWHEGLAHYIEQHRIWWGLY